MLTKCRTCLKEEHSLVDLFKIDNLMTLSSQIMSIAKIDIHINDKLPRVICKKCLRKLRQCIAFKTLCEKSDLQLRSELNIGIKLIKSNTIEDIRNFDSFCNKNDCTSECERKALIDNNNVQEVDINNSIFDSVPSKCNLFKNKSNKLGNKDISTDDAHSIESISETGEYKKDENKVSVSEIDRYGKRKLNDEVNISENNVLNDKNKHKIRKVNNRHQCFICGKITSSGFRLKTHLATHSDDRPFACKYCNRRFSINENLKVHLRIHTGEKPFRCTVCGENFAHSAGLAIHKRKHTGQTPYKCNVCPRSFRTYTSMQYHNRLHADDRNYECEICNRAFISRGNLQLHISTHSGEKPHRCAVCGTGFARVSNLKRHLRYVHKKTNTKEFLKDATCIKSIDNHDIKKTE